MRQGIMRYSLGILLVFMATGVMAQQPIIRTTVLNNTIQEPKFTVTAALPTPDFKVNAITDPNDTSRNLYYTIGGLRLKFDFDTSSLSEQQKAASPVYEWTFGRAGRECTSFDLINNNTNCTTKEANATITDKTTVWWEPDTWASPAITEAQLKITFNEPEKNPETKIRFKLESRTLKPIMATAAEPDLKPMEGSDRLWRLP